MGEQVSVDATMSRDFRWLLAGRGVDAIGNAVHPLALGFAMLALFGDITSLGIVVGSAMLGQVLLLLAGGVVADRLPRSVVMVWSNHLAAVMQFGVVALVVFEVRSLWAIAALSFVTGAASAFDRPAMTAILPQVVTAVQLPRANARLGMLEQSARIGAAPVAGLLFVTVGPAWTLSVNAVSFVVAGLCFARMSPVPIELSGNSPLRDLVEGWHEFVSRTWVWVVVLAFFLMVPAIVGGFHVIGISIADRLYGADGWGLVLGANGVGAVVGAWFAGRMTVRRPMIVAMLAATFFSLPLFALSAEVPLVVLVSLMAVEGAAMMVFIVLWDSALQQHIPPQKLARVSSIDHVGSMAATPIGIFAAGPLAVAYGETRTVFWAGVLVVVVALVSLLSRAVRNLRAIEA